MTWRGHVAFYPGRKWWSAPAVNSKRIYLLSLSAAAEKERGRCARSAWAPDCWQTEYHCLISCVCEVWRSETLLSFLKAKKKKISPVWREVSCIKAKVRLTLGDERQQPPEYSEKHFGLTGSACVTWEWTWGFCQCLKYKWGGSLFRHLQAVHDLVQLSWQGYTRCFIVPRCL